MSSSSRSILTGLLIFGVLIGGGWYSLDRLIWGDVDYSKDPPNRLFRSILGLDIPPGVTDLRTAGRAGPLGLKSWVWMRFHYGEKELPALLDGKSPLSKTEGVRSLVLPDMPMRRVQEDQRAVGWEDLAAIEDPAYFLTTGGYPGSAFVWYGTLVLDRKRKLAFVQVFGD
jgi:hypothetical protein